MNLEKLDKDVAKEVLLILLHSSEEIQDKIPEKVIKDLFFLAADSKKDVYLYKNRKLYEQNLSKKALDIFALIYYAYVSNELERKEIISSWVLNDKKEEG